ncbi:hypothetical protein [Bacillus licheniformis]|uniref:hypothetical protein n=1 Tax=Bacillus licheniformis TaxID=1402 RepID=UPI00119D0DAF|nr:hypothetical protein [Bacillus licheniformis]MCA1184655.1 hypothetical protein [Bacillus licheniformis]TWL43017.1 hypothetical protein CHCC15543_4173 [Bacillus licheniformis]
MSLLDKINNVTIDNNERISKADSDFCFRQYFEYFQAKNVNEEALKMITSVYERQKENDSDNLYCYIDKYDDIRHFEKRLEQLREDFVYRIIRYFSDKYKVTLDAASIITKYGENLSGRDVLDEIFEQLGGYSFEEKAVTEIIQASQNSIYNFNERVTIKKASISITHFVSWDTWWDDYRLGWNNEKLETLFKALSHFENGSTETLDLLNRMKQHLCEGEKEYNIFSKYEFKFQKIKSIRVYKNGKITIEFNSNEQANEFANTYLKK